MSGEKIKPGYKSTDAGVIPEDWEVRLLGELAVIRDGTHQTPRYQPSGVPFYSVEHVTSGDFENTKFISEEEHLLLTRYVQIEKGDILMTRIGSIGECKLIDWDVRASFYVSLALLKIKNASAEYITQYSNHSAFKKEVELHSLQHATPKKINLGPISRIKIALPSSKEEQHAIATTLADVDDLLDNLDQLILKKRDIKKAALQQLLTGKIRLPGFTGGWVTKKLGDICRITTGKKDVNEGCSTGQYPFFTCARVHTYSDTYSFDGEAILIAGNGEVGNLSRYNGKFEAYQRTYVLQNFSTETSYLWHQLVANLAKHLGISTIGSSIPYIKMENLVEFQFQSPIDEAEQIAISKSLSDIDTEIASIESRRDKINAIKQGMMQELLTGNVRLVHGQTQEITVS